MRTTGLFRPRLRRLRVVVLCLFLLVEALAGSAGAVPIPPVLIAGQPVAPPLASKGTGLCAAFRVADPIVFGTEQPDPSFFPERVNTFLDSQPEGRATATLKTLFDFSNQVENPPKISSDGDYTRFVSQCPPPGCEFTATLANGGSFTFKEDFGSRFRGFLNVASDLVDVSIHFGFFTDDAVALVVYDKDRTPHYVVSRGPTLGTAQWRITNQVKFKNPGLYPVEVVHAQIQEAAVLEWSMLLDPMGQFKDFERSVSDPNLPPPVPLSQSGFVLLPPDRFFQTINGMLPYSDANRCEQCPRRFVNAPGGGPKVGCSDDDHFCNDAAVCAPCREKEHCGSLCNQCGADRPICADVNGVQQCVECVTDVDCQNGVKGRNGRCEKNVCVACDTPQSCAGNSCNCCPPETPLCAVVDPAMGAAPRCVECRGDADCMGFPDRRLCDLVNHRCTAKAADCNSDDRCGPGCVKCPAEGQDRRPYCLDGKVCVQCRSDLDCGAGRYCLSGECFPCITDRRCGSACRSCGGDAPFCRSGGSAENAQCVRCFDDSQCGDAGHCDKAKGTCQNSCPMSCDKGLVCNGSKCVECYASTQCPCGKSCQVSIGKCSNDCNDTTDCQADQCCSPDSHKCEVGRCKPGVSAHGGALCCQAAPAGVTAAPDAGERSRWWDYVWAGLLLIPLPLWLARRRRR